IWPYLPSATSGVFNMKGAIRERPAAEVKAVALKAFGAIAESWSLTGREAAQLADMSETNWKRAKKPGFAGEITRDQDRKSTRLNSSYYCASRMPYSA